MNFPQQDGISKLVSLGAKMLSTFMKHLAAFLIICVAVVGYFWLKISDHSPLNSCEPTDVVRIKLDEREYHIPVEWRPSISQRLSDGADCPTRFSYEDLQGNALERGWWNYCQGKDEKAVEYKNITLNPKKTTILNSEKEKYKYIRRLNYLGVRVSNELPPKISTPSFQIKEIAYDGLFWRYANQVDRADKYLKIYSKGWTHEGAHVLASISIFPDETERYIVRAASIEGRKLRFEISYSNPAGFSENDSSFQIHPQEWPALLKQMTNLMRSFEVAP
ncbi:hypothetical protein [Roseibium sp.]|uniref:hypothetical protein n=1 Tax=Roseibium sp. TaxID=1936156 RepID=UPI003D1460DC